jgi:2',3'-cyclic-nucleotide 2'-phosphodiesterase (5'-nucleotidase family)
MGKTNSIRILFLLILFFGLYFSPCLYSQNDNPKFTFQYQTVKMDSVYDEPKDLTMSTYIETLRTQMGEKLNVIIGEAATDLPRFKPQSPLSNFLVDQLFIYGNSYLITNHYSDTVDLALLNLGGIRAPINAGMITIETMYQIAPFDNYVVIIYLKGSELKKMFKKFTEKDNGILANAQTIYQNGKIISYTIHGKAVVDEQIYVLTTIDFLQTGGDGYLSGLNFEKVIYTGVLVRDVYTSRITKLTELGRKIEGKTDQRVIIKPTP